MFNRGRQDISAEELGTDLAALEKIGGNAAEAGHRVLGKFFFVYVAEARFAEPDSPQRRYEFLHATFGEYLVARLVVEELCEVARAAFSSRRGVREPEDDLLFALLSFEPLSTRQPTLKFAREMCAAIDVEDRDHIVEVLMTLIAGHRDRHGSDKYQDYRPLPVDRVRELAAYTANLVLLLVAVHPDRRVSLSIFWKWPSTLRLWQSGLDGESYNGVLSILANEKGRLRLVDGAVTPGVVNDHLTALLAEDRDMAFMYRYGSAFTFNTFDARPGDTWSEVMYPWLSVALARQNRNGFDSIFMTIPDDADPDMVNDFCERLAMLLKSHAYVTDIDQMKVFVQVLLDKGHRDPVALASAVLAHPQLLSLVPDLNDAALYSTYAARLMFMAESPGHPLLERLCRRLETK